MGCLVSQGQTGVDAALSTPSVRRLADSGIGALAGGALSGDRGGDVRATSRALSGPPLYAYPGVCRCQGTARAHTGGACY
jgi:hypothetical protein